ncbi:MAG: BPL-N domain-containing protein, partial [Rariglobus sp.]
MTTPFRLLSLLSLGFALLIPPLAAQVSDDESDATPVAKVSPADINGRRTIIPPPTSTKPLRLAIYKGKGSGLGGINNTADRAKRIPGTTVTMLTGEQIAGGALKNADFDVIAFTGGSGSKQSAGIGDEGLAEVRKFVDNGGGYLGICAGAYLAADYTWGLKIINARTVSQKWMRGTAYLDLETDPSAAAIVGDVKGTFKCRYANGPILKPSNLTTLPDYKVAAWFRSET